MPRSSAYMREVTVLREEKGIVLVSFSARDHLPVDAQPRAREEFDGQNVAFSPLRLQNSF